MPARFRLPRVSPVTLVAVAAAFVLPFVISASQLTTAVFVVILAIGAVGLNVLTGFAGQVSLGHAFFLGIGAYTGAVLGADAGWSAALWIPAAGVVAGLVGAIIGPVALRLRGLYLAIVTLGLVFIGEHLFLNMSSITGGPAGRAFPPIVIGPFDFSPGQALDLGGLVIDRSGLYYYLSLILLLAAVAYTANLVRGRTGRAMQAVRERELAAAVLGVGLARAKLAAFVISSVLAGISGALYASYLSYAQPGQWNLLLSIQFIAAAIIGGLGSVWGPVLGSIVIFSLPQLLESLPLFAEEGSGVSAGDAATIIYGVLIMAFLVFEPRGLVGLGSRLRLPNKPVRRPPERIEASA